MDLDQEVPQRRVARHAVSELSPALDKNSTSVMTRTDDRLSRSARAVRGTGWLARVRDSVIAFLGRPERWTNAGLGVAYLLGVVTVAVAAATAYTIHRSLAPSAGPVLFQRFADAPNGAISVADSGDPWTVLTNGAPGAELRVIDGKLTNDTGSSGPAAGSISADLPSAVSRVSAVFGFSSGATDDGSVAIVVGINLPREGNASSDLTSPCQIVVTPTKLALSVVNGGEAASLGAADFSQRLAADTDYPVNIEIDYDVGVVRIDGPDDRTRVFSDDRVRTNRGSIITYQIFQNNPVTDNRPYIDEVQAW